MVYLQILNKDESFFFFFWKNEVVSNLDSCKIPISNMGLYNCLLCRPIAREVRGEQNHHLMTPKCALNQTGVCLAKLIFTGWRRMVDSLMSLLHQQLSSAHGNQHIDAMKCTYGIGCVSLWCQKPACEWVCEARKIIFGSRN